MHFLYEIVPDYTDFTLLTPSFHHVLGAWRRLFQQTDLCFNAFDSILASSSTNHSKTFKERLLKSAIEAWFLKINSHSNTYFYAWGSSQAPLLALPKPNLLSAHDMGRKRGEHHSKTSESN